MSRRRIRDPHNYAPPAVAAAGLRKIADDLERDGKWAKWHIQISVAPKDEIEAATSKVPREAPNA